MKILVLHQPFPMGNYKLNTEIAKKFHSEGHEVYLIQQLNGSKPTQEYVQSLKEQDFDLVYFEMLDFESFNVVEQLKGEKILLQASGGVLGSYEKILDYKGVWYDKIFTNSIVMKALFDKNKIPSEHFQFYFSPIVEEEKVVVEQYKNNCTFLGMGFGRLTSPSYQLERDIFFCKDIEDLSIYGIGWEGQPQWKGILPAEDIGKLYSSTKSAAAIIAKGQREKGMINNRYSEIASCGAPLITYNYREIDWFGADRFLNFVSSKEELKSTISSILENPEDYLDKANEFKSYISLKSEEFFLSLNKLIQS